MAGHDVLAISLRAMWYFLAKNPRVLHNLRAELKEAQANVPEGQKLTAQGLSSLPYL